MLYLIPIVGGLLIMMGQHDCSESLFYYFRLEDQIPENHLLRLIEKHISFEFVRERLRNSYSETGPYGLERSLQTGSKRAGGPRTTRRDQFTSIARHPHARNERFSILPSLQ
jgi:hypothetical protein